MSDREICSTFRVQSASRDLGLWYWYGGSEKLGIPRNNTCDKPVKTLEEAKKQAEEYVRQYLPKREK